jgi:ribosomal protein L28
MMDKCYICGVTPTFGVAPCDSCMLKTIKEHAREIEERLNDQLKDK